MTNTLKVSIKKLQPDAPELSRGSAGAAALDVAFCGGQPIRIPGGSVKLLSTGWSFELPEDYAMLILPRSGLARKHRLRPVNTPGLLDADYRGELFIAMENAAHPDTIPVTINPGDYVAQLLFVPIGQAELVRVDELSKTERGENGFGSTEIFDRRWSTS